MYADRQDTAYTQHRVYTRNAITSRCTARAYFNIMYNNLMRVSAEMTCRFCYRRRVSVRYRLLVLVLNDVYIILLYV